MSLNLAQVFVRYPELEGVRQALQPWMAARLRARIEVPRLIAAETGGPWIAVYAGGDNPPPELAQHLSRSLEAEALWFGVAGRLLAYRRQVWRHGRRISEETAPPEIFGLAADRVPLPTYPDAEREVFEWLDGMGIPPAHRFLGSAELGASPDSPDRAPNAFLLGPAADSPDGLDEREFHFRTPRREEAAVRTLFDRFDGEHAWVEDDVALRGTYEAQRARRLLTLLQAMSLRRTLPRGWAMRYRLESRSGPELLGPIAALHHDEAEARGWTYELAPP